MELLQPADMADACMSALQRSMQRLGCPSLMHCGAAMLGGFALPGSGMVGLSDRRAAAASVGQWTSSVPVRFPQSFPSQCMLDFFLWVFFFPLFFLVNAWMLCPWSPPPLSPCTCTLIRGRQHRAACMLSATGRDMAAYAAHAASDDRGRQPVLACRCLIRAPPVATHAMPHCGGGNARWCSLLPSDVTLRTP
jgi:hypothetical protein